MSWFGYTGVMARNDQRRSTLADAGIRVLAEQGARGLTHRAIDEAAGTPKGTASNYFPTREDLISALVDRIAERLTPVPGAVPHDECRQPDRALFTAYIRDVVKRLSVDPHVTLALFELRLEAGRRPAVAKTVGEWRQRSFEEDIAFTAHMGLPGGPTEVALLHYAIEGLMFDRLTVPLDTDVSLDAAVDELVSRILK